MDLKEKNSFTLIEVLVVIAIIAILSSALFLYTKSTKEDAKIASALQLRNSISNVLGAYNVGAWRFEGATINESGYDSSGHKNDCTPVNSSNISYISSVHNSLGKALKINNNNGWLNCGDSASKPNLFPSNAITLEAWAKADSVPNSYRGIVTNKRENNYGINLYIHRDNIGSRIGRTPNNNTLVTTTWAPSANTWYHIVITYNSKNRKAILYVNGKIEREMTLESDIRYHGTNNFFGIGCNYKTDTTCNGPFRGTIDDVKVYNESLVFAQVQEHYAEGLQRLELAGLK